MELPRIIPGHWDTVSGHEMALTYAEKGRSNLAMGGLTDLGLANAVFIVSRNDVRLIDYQTAAKERIRWLSVQLALAYGALEAVGAVRSSNWNEGDDPEMQSAFEAVDAVLAGRSK
ncbi:MAG: hypothetical protein U9R73_00750 [Pseudomonadota bacterium]|nr:hypothetical protein [Pseudomonadota bacterium]